MGLDMYLHAKKYVSGYEHSDEHEKKLYRTILKHFGLNGNFKIESPSAVVELTVAYWRKANQVHAWFVSEVQDGKDECQNSHVDREKLQELVDLCKTALADRGKAKEILPTQKGFFFGSTDYDDDYLQDLENTVKQVGSVSV